MFSKKITNSSEFLMMSQSAQSLYFHLGMNADDDGICEAFTIMRMTESKPDDLSVLHAKGFIYIVDNKILIIRDWHENNLIRMDRYEKSRYLTDKKIEDIYNGIMPKQLGKGMVNHGLTQDRIGKDSIEKNTNFSSKKIMFYRKTGERIVESPAGSGKLFIVRNNEFLEFADKKSEIEYK